MTVSKAIILMNFDETELPIPAPLAARRGCRRRGFAAARARHCARRRGIDRDRGSRAQPSPRGARGDRSARRRGRGDARLSAARGPLRGAASQADAARFPAAGGHQPLSAHARRAHLGVRRFSSVAFNVTSHCHFVEGFNPEALAEACSIMPAAPKASPSWRSTIRWCAMRSARSRPAAYRSLTMISDIPETPRTAYVGLDNRAAGRTAGLLIGRFVGERRGKVALIAGSRSYRAHEERETGIPRHDREAFPALDRRRLARRA